MTQISSLIERANAARLKAADWLLAHVGADGRPADSDVMTGWTRLSWGLVVAGHSEVAARAVTWIVANRIAPNGSLRPGYVTRQGYIASYPHYWLGTFVMSAWLAGMTNEAMRSMAYLRSQQDPISGGLPMQRETDEPEPVCDMLSTAQVGLSALVVGDHEVAHRCAAWVRRLAEQDANESLVFHACMRGKMLWTEPDPPAAWASINDFAQPRQAFYPPGMGAVFLARYAGRYACEASLDAARRLVAFNMLGHAAQFDDVDSVQACKFGWAIAELYHADRGGEWLEWAVRMTEWFLVRQAPEGSWGPSKFADPSPSVADRMVKTSEHLMELSALITALAASQARARMLASG